MLAIVQRAAVQSGLEMPRRPESTMENPFSVCLDVLSGRLDKKCSAVLMPHKRKDECTDRTREYIVTLGNFLRRLLVMPKSRFQALRYIKTTHQYILGEVPFCA